VAYYRMYFENAAGRILRVHEAVLDDDAAAIAEANRLDHAHVVSVWQQDRKVADVRPTGVTPDDAN